MSVDAGKSSAALSAGVDHIAAVMGCESADPRVSTYEEVVLLEASTVPFSIKVLPNTHVFTRPGLLS